MVITHEAYEVKITFRARTKSTRPSWTVSGGKGANFGDGFYNDHLKKMLCFVTQVDQKHYGKSKTHTTTLMKALARTAHFAPTLAPSRKLKRHNMWGEKQTNLSRTRSTYLSCRMPRALESPVQY